MSVRFSDLTTIFPASDHLSSCGDTLREASDRCRAEQHSLSLSCSPSTEFSRVRHVFESCRFHDITIIFGNLGRNPLMLTYFLDLVFTHHESVGIQTEWRWNTPYDGNPSPHYDYLFCIEPYFGYCVTPLAHVKHLIMLTSHLSLTWPSQSHVVPLYIGEPIQQLPTPELKGSPVRPPLYHQEKINTFQNDVIFDVTHSKSAHDAYLRLLTGRELARRTRYACRISKRNADMIKFHVQKIEVEAKARHWTAAWIQDGYLKAWETVL